MNALAFDPISETFQDPFGGSVDITNKIIRFVGDPEDRIEEDHLRILRCFRFASQLGFEIDTDALVAIQHFVEKGNPLAGVSQERITAEFSKIMTGPDVVETIRFMAETGILFEIIPELKDLMTPHNSPFHTETFDEFGNTIFAHVMHVLLAGSVNGVDNDLKLRLALLMHDIGKPACRTEKRPGHDRFLHHDIVGAEMTEEILTRMKFPNDVIKSVSELVRMHMHVHDLPKMKKVHSIRRLMGRNDFDMLLKLAVADTIGTAGNNGVPNHIDADILIGVVKKHQASFPVMLPDPIVTGADLIAAGQKPGPAFAGALKTAFNFQLDGCNDKVKGVNQALSFIRTTI